MRAKKTKTKKEPRVEKKKSIIHREKVKIKKISADDLIEDVESEKGKHSVHKKIKGTKRPPFVLYLFILLDIALVIFIFYNNPSLNKSAKIFYNNLTAGAPAQTVTKNTALNEGIPLDNIDTFIVKERKLYKNTKYNYQVGYLEDWNVASMTDELFSIYVNPDKKTPPYFSISVLKNLSGMTMEKTANADLTAYKGYATVDTIYFIYPNTLKVKVDRSKGGNKVNPTYSEILYVGNGKNYVFKIEATANSKTEFEDMRIDFENNFASFKVGQ